MSDPHFEHPGTPIGSEGVRVIQYPMQPGVFIPLDDNTVVFSPTRVLNPGDYHLWEYPPANLVNPAFRFSQLIPPGGSPVKIRTRSDVNSALPEHYLISGVLPFVQNSNGLVHSRPSKVSGLSMKSGLRPTMLDELSTPRKSAMVFRTPHLTIHSVEDLLTVVSIPNISRNLYELVTAV